MSRVFNGDIANFLSAAVGVGADRANFSIMAWVKTAATASGIAHTLNNSFNSPRLQSVTGTFPLQALFGSTGSNVVDFDNRIVSDSWLCLVGVTTPTRSTLRAGAGNYETTSAYTSLLASAVSALRVGSGDSLSPWNGKIAHVAAWNRELLAAEIDTLTGGGNPNSIASAARWYYYPLTDASLGNVWTPTDGDTAGALTVNGTVASDAGDNPTVTGGGGGSAAAAAHYYRRRRAA